MSEGVPAPRKRMQPTKPRTPNKTKVVSQTKVDEAPPIIGNGTVMWEKELDDLFCTLREPQDEDFSSTEKCRNEDGSTSNAARRIARSGYPGTVTCYRKSRTRCTLCYVKGFPIVSVKNRVKYGSPNASSPESWTLFFNMCSKNAERQGCQFFQWINEVWSFSRTIVRLERLVCV